MPEVSFFDTIHFLRPWWLLALIPILLALLNLRRLQNTAARWEGVVAPHLLKHLLVEGSSSQRLTPLKIAAAFSFLAIVALAGPSWRQAKSPFFQDEASLVIALDLSTTMLAEDVQPTRLERAKQKISDLMTIRGGAPTSLIVYAGSAHTVIPLSNDPDIINNLLAGVSPDIIPVKGKRPEALLPVAEAMLRESEVPGTLLLLTDAIGDPGQLAFENYFKQEDHQLLVWGIGQSDTNPGETESPFKPDTLRALSSACGGYYQSLTLDKTDAERIQRRTKSYLVTAKDEFSPWVDDGYYLAIPMAILIALWFRKGWTLSWE